MIALVIALGVAVLSGVGYGVYALTAKPNVDSSQASATATGSANALLNDPLTSDLYGWSSSTSHCYFDQDGYHINNGYSCSAPIGAVADGSVSVTVKELAGSVKTGYGINFRLNTIENRYLFAIDSNSKWVLLKSLNGVETRMLDFTYNSAIHGGLNVENRLTVTFRGQHIIGMVNGVIVCDLTDSGESLGAGKVALVAGPNVNAVFTNFLALP